MKPNKHKIKNAIRGILNNEDLHEIIIEAKRQLRNPKNIQGGQSLLKPKQITD